MESLVPDAPPLASQSSTVSNNKDDVTPRRRDGVWVWTDVGFGRRIHPIEPEPKPEQKPRAEAEKKEAEKKEGVKKDSDVPVAPPLSSAPVAPAPPVLVSASSGAKAPSLVELLTPPSAAKSDTFTPPSLDPSTVDPSVQPDHAVVHLLPHHALPSAQALIDAACKKSHTASDAFSPSTTTHDSALIQPLHPTLLYTPITQTHTRIRINVRTFLNLEELMKKDDDEDGDEAADSDPSRRLKAMLGRDLRARKEQMEMDRLTRQLSSGSLSKDEMERLEKRLAELQKERAEEEAKEKAKEEAKAKARESKQPGPPPQSLSFDVECNMTVEELLQKVVDAYEGYGVSLSTESMRLVSNGVEIARSSFPDLGSGSGSSGASSDSSEQEQEMIRRVLRLPGAAASLAAAQVAAMRGAMASGIQASSGLAAALSGAQSGPVKIDIAATAALHMIKDALWQVMHPGAAAYTAKTAKPTTTSSTSKIFAPSSSKVAAQAQAAAGSGANYRPLTQTDRDRYLRAHTMLAECGLVPASRTNPAGSTTEMSATSSTATSSNPTTSSSSSSSSSSIPLPSFNLLLIYDDESRFIFDSNLALLTPEVHLNSDHTIATMIGGADQRWVTVRANRSYTSGRHAWSCKMERCGAGNMFIGVCAPNMKLNNYIGCDTNGYGYYGCGNSYRNGSSSSYGSGYRTGDIIRVLLDMDARTCSFEKNGQALGVAFRDLPDTVYPAVSLYTKLDQVRICDWETF